MTMQTISLQQSTRIKWEQDFEEDSILLERGRVLEEEHLRCAFTGFAPGRRKASKEVSVGGGLLRSREHTYLQSTVKQSGLSMLNFVRRCAQSLSHRIFQDEVSCSHLDGPKTYQATGAATIPVQIHDGVMFIRSFSVDFDQSLIASAQQKNTQMCVTHSFARCTCQNCVSHISIKC